METSRFFPYQWHLDEQQDENNVTITIIRVYGLTEQNENICVQIKSFTPYVYIELPPHILWTAGNAQMVGNKLEQLLGIKIHKKQLVMKKKLYGAHMNEKGGRKLFPYLFCNFPSKKYIRTLEYILRKQLYVSGIGALQLKMHEHNADPILQLTCCRKIPTAGWIQFTGRRVKPENQVTLCDHEFSVQYKNLSPYQQDSVAQPKIMGFDIEVNSSNPSAMPNATKPADKVFQISCVLAREGEKEEEYEKYLLTLGTPDETVGEDVNVYMYEIEADLLVGFTEFIKEHNPNIITGYNILGFDIPYLILRAKRQMVMSQFNLQGFHKYKHANEKTIKWSSSAYKNQEFQFLDAEGRLFVDLLPLVRRDYKMDNYKLKTISQYFLKGDTKDDLSPKGIFKCYRLGIKGGKRGDRAMAIVGKYCVKDAVLVVKLMDKLKIWVGLCEMAKTCNVPIFTLYTQGQQIKVFSQVYKYATYNNIVIEKDGYQTKEDERYTGAHVFDPIPGVYDRVLPFDFASLYPTTIIAYNIDYSTLVTDDSVPDKQCHVMKWEDHQGCVHDPKVIKRLKLTEIINKKKEKIKLWKEKRKSVKTIAEQKNYTEKIDKLTLEMKPDLEKRSVLVKSKPKVVMCAKRHYRFLKEPKGVLPTILQNLLDTRKHTRTKIKHLKQTLTGDEEEDKETNLLIDVLDKRQLAYKVSSNSMYGAMGVRRGYLPFMPGAMCTTFMGRTSIEKVAKEIPEKYGGQLIYGDTDSNYIHFPHLKTAEESWDYAEYVAEEVSKLFPAPMKLEFEEVIYWRFFILTKKRYMYTSCGRDGKVGAKIGKKGVLLARRDNSAFIRDLYETVISKIFNREEKRNILLYILDHINLLCSNYFSHQKFVVTKAVGDVNEMNVQTVVNEKGIEKAQLGDYVAPLLSTDPEEKLRQFRLKECHTEEEYYERCLPAQVQLAQKMRRRGQRVDPGTRIEYVITDIGKPKAKQYEKLEHIDYFNQYKHVLKIDFLYYLKLLCNPLDQVLNVAYGNDTSGFFKKDFVLDQYKFRQTQREKMMSELKQLFAPTLVFEK